MKLRFWCVNYISKIQQSTMKKKIKSCYSQASKVYSVRENEYANEFRLLPIIPFRCVHNTPSWTLTFSTTLFCSIPLHVPKWCIYLRSDLWTCSFAITEMELKKMHFREGISRKERKFTFQSIVEKMFLIWGLKLCFSFNSSTFFLHSTTCLRLPTKILVWHEDHYWLCRIYVKLSLCINAVLARDFNIIVLKKILKLEVHNDRGKQGLYCYLPVIWGFNTMSPLSWYFTPFLQVLTDRPLSEFIFYALKDCRKDISYENAMTWREQRLLLLAWIGAGRKDNCGFPIPHSHP